MTGTYTIIVEGLTVEMRLGIHPHEATPQPVRISVWMDLAYPQPLPHDRIEDVLDYDFVRDGVKALAGGPGFALQETLCDAIAALCLRDTRVVRVRVRSVKTDIYPDAQVGCEVVRSRT